MSLEQAIQALTAAVEANTAALKAGGGATTEKAATTKTKPAADTYTPKHTKDEMTAVLNEVKEKFGTPVAKAIVNEVGKAAKMAEITDPKIIDACYEAGRAKLEAADEV